MHNSLVESVWDIIVVHNGKTCPLADQQVGGNAKTDVIDKKYDNITHMIFFVML